MTILEEQFPVPNTTARKMGNGVTPLLGQLKCHCNPDHNKFFHLNLVQLWSGQFFQISVYGDIVYVQTWEVLTLKNCIEPP